MLYLLLAIASSAMVSICMRISEKYARGNMVMFTANYAVCLAVSLLYTGGLGGRTFDSGMTWAAALGAVSGFMYLASFVLLQKNIRHNGVILSGAAMKLGGVLVPVIAAVAVFHDTLGWVRLAGVAVSVAAVVLINVEKASAGEGGKKYWLIILLLGSGLTDTMVNVYDKTGAAAFKNHYLLFTFLAAMVISFTMALVKKERAGLADILCGLMIGVPNYYSSRFLLLSLESVPAVIAYPVFSAGTIIVVSATGVLLFREKLSRRKIWALLLILAALALLNI